MSHRKSRTGPNAQSTFHEGPSATNLENFLDWIPDELGVRRALTGDVRAACSLWARVAQKLRSSTQLTEFESTMLADALEAAVIEPKKAGNALGLIRKKGRPRRTGVARVAGHQVRKLFSEGVPLEQAFRLVMDSFKAEFGTRLTEDQLRRGYDDARAQARRWKANREAARKWIEELG